MQRIIYIIICCCWGHVLLAQSNINKAEYFINTDPGFGNGINIPLPPAAINLADVNFNANLNLATDGLNSLFVRTRTADGKWSLTNRFLFVKLGSVANANITRVEYFMDADPGFGIGTSLPISPGQNLSDVGGQVNITGITDGLHSFFIRSRDANGKWSITNRFLFVKLGSVANANITRVEYFMDADPGFGIGTSLPISPGQNLSDVAGQVNLTGITDGLHSLFIRSRDANGKWSITNRFLFVKLGSIANPSINRVEYFIDTDPGFGNATALTVTPSPNVADVAAQIDLSGTSNGLHSLFLRSRDANNKWSQTNRFLFVKMANQEGQPNITQAEYFIDSDPGFGNGIQVALNPAGVLPDFIMDVNITGLAVGDHRLFLRTCDANGRWSITNVYKFPIAALVATPQLVVNSMTKLVMCGDTDFVLAFHATGTYNPGNIFTVQLSNAAGNFTNPTAIGSLTATASGFVNCNIPLSIPNGNNYRVRVVSTNPVVTGAASNPVFTLYKQPRYNDTTVFIVCQGQTFNLNNVYNTSGFTVSFNTSPANAAPVGNYFMYSKNTELCKDTAAIIVKQDVAQWTGATNKNWHVATNWSTGMVPASFTHVIIPAGIVNTCEVSASNAAAASVQVRPGGILTFTNSRQIIISGRCNPLPISP